VCVFIRELNGQRQGKNTRLGLIFFSTTNYLFVVFGLFVCCFFFVGGGGVCLCVCVYVCVRVCVCMCESFIRELNGQRQGKNTRLGLNLFLQQKKNNKQTNQKQQRGNLL